MTMPGGMDRNVQVTLKADIDPFQRGMEAANKSVTVLTSSVVTLAKKIDELWKSAGRKLEVFGAGGLASLVAATEAANRLDVAFRGVRSTAALTGQSVNQLKDGVAGLARSLPASNSALAQLAGQVQDLGVTGTANIVKFTEVAVRLGAATNTQPGALFSDLLQLTRAMGSNIQNIDRYSSSLVALSKQNGVASQQILGFANAIEAVAQRAGYTETQVLGLSTAFSKAGADSGAGATAFIKITNDISEAVRTGSSVLDQYATIAGKSTAEFKAMSQSNPAAAFIEVINAIKDAGPRGISILQQLGMDGARTQRAIAALTSGQANLAQAMDQSSDAYIKNQALNKSSNAAFNDLSSAMTKFRTAIAQITEAMGGPFLGVATKMVEAVTSVINLFNRMPDSVKTALAIFAALASSVTLVSGAFLVVSLAVLKFGMVWRVLSGAMGSNIFKGLIDGLRGAPRELDNTSAAMTRLYNATYRVTNAARGSRMAGEVGPVASIMGQQGASGMYNVLGFPARKFRAEVREVKDTLKHPIDYRERSDDAWSPYGIPGMTVAAKKKIQGNDTLRGARDALLGTPEESLERAQQANQRLRAIADERSKIFDQSYKKMKEALRNNREEFDADAAAFFNPKNKPADKGGTTPENLTDKQRVRYMQNAAQAEANAAAKKMRDAFKEEDGDAALSPFKTMVLKIKTMSGEMVDDIANGTGKIMDLVSAAFAQSVAKIVELAARAKIALMEIQNGSPGSGTAGLAGAVSSLGGAAATAGGFVASGAAGLSTQAGKITQTAPAAASLESRILGGLGPLANNANSYISVKTLQQQAEGSAEKSGGLGDKVSELKDKFSGAADGIKEKAEGAGSKLGQLGGKALGLIGPMAMFGTALYGGISALRSYADGQRKAGQDIANDLANSWGLPQRNQPAAPDKTTPRSMWEVANSSDFLKNNPFDKSIEGMGGGSAGKRALAATQYQMLLAKGQGQPLTKDQKDSFTETLMHQFGQNEGQKVANQIFSGPSGATNFQGVYSAAAAASNGWQGTNKKSAQVGYQTLAEASTASTSNLAGVLLAAQTARDKAGPGSSEDIHFGTLLSRVGKANDFGLQGPIYANDLTSFIKELNEGGPQAQDSAKQLTAYLKSIGYDGKNAAAVLDKVNLSLSGIGATGGSANSPIDQYNKTRYAQAMGTNFDYSNLQTNNAQLGLAAGGYRLGGDTAFGSAGFYGNQLSALLQARSTQAVQGDPNRLALINQQITSARSGVAQQRGLTMSGLQQMGAMSDDIMNMSAGGNAKYNIADIQDEAQQLGSLQSSQVDQLKSFILQVKQMNRQREYNEQDHTLQLSHMYRDRKIQQDEAIHSYNESIRSSMYETATAFGNPGAFVQSTYTQSATSAYTGLTEQNEYLKRSKTAMDTLGKMGLSKDAIRLMGLDDPKNFQQAERFVHDMAANPKLISQWNASIKGRLDISKGIATDINNSKFADMKRSFDYAGKQASDAFKRSLSDFQTAYDTAQKREKDNITNLVTDAMTGIGDIMAAAKSTGVTAIQQYANAIITQAGRSNTAIQSVVNAANALNMGGGGTSGPTGGYTATNLTGGSKGGGYGDVGVSGGGGQYNDRTGKYTPGTSTYVNPGTAQVYSGGTSGSGSSSNFKPSGDFMKQHPAQPSFNRQIAKQMAPQWAKGDQWSALDKLWTRESGWNQYADNPSSSAYGIPQSLPGTKMSTAGKDWRTNPATQIAWGLKYIAGRYGSPLGAWEHETKMGWYGKGGITMGRQVIGVGEQGPEMVLPLNGQGTSFIAAVVAQSMQRMGITTSAMRGVRTAGYAGPTQATSYHHVDASQNFSGDITVQSQDPSEMARKLADKKRLAALTRPAGGRG